MNDEPTYEALLWRCSRNNPRYLRDASKRRAKLRGAASKLIDAFTAFCLSLAAAALYDLLKSL